MNFHVFTLTKTSVCRLLKLRDHRFVLSKLYDATDRRTDKVRPIPITALSRLTHGKQESCAIAKMTARCALYK